MGFLSTILKVTEKRTEELPGMLNPGFDGDLKSLYLQRCAISSERIYVSKNIQKSKSLIFSKAGYENIFDWFDNLERTDKLIVDKKAIIARPGAYEETKSKLLKKFEDDRAGTVDDLLRGIDLRKFSDPKFCPNISDRVELPATDRAWASLGSSEHHQTDSNIQLLGFLALTTNDVSNWFDRNITRLDNAISDKERDALVAVIDAKLSVLKKEMEAIEKNRIVNGIDILLQQYILLRLINQKSSMPCDYCGRRLRDDKQLSVLLHLGVVVGAKKKNLFMPDDTVFDGFLD